MMPIKLIRKAAVLAAAAMAFGCAASSGSASTSSRPSRNNDVISADQMRDAQATTLYEAVQRLHPEWLMQRNASTLGGANARRGGSAEVQVFVSGQHTGGLAMLRQLPITEAGSLHYYTAAQSESKFGSGFPNGVIEVLPPGKP